MSHTVDLALCFAALCLVLAGVVLSAYLASMAMAAFERSHYPACLRFITATLLISAATSVFAFWFLINYALQ